MTANEIHDIGLQEVERIEKRYIHDILLPLGYKENEFDKFIEFVKHDKQFYVKTSEELLSHYKNMCTKISEIMPNYFNEIPKSPLEIVQKSVGPAAYYLAGTADGTRPGRFYVNCSEIDKRPLYESIALSLHEANPGHHHQCAITLENKNLPNFMRFFEDRRYEVGPSKRSMATAYVEGWGLYSEYLGEEMGLYTTPYELFGRLSMEMMRAVRLVVDTGIHSKGWSLERAIHYMMEKTGMHRHEVETEIYRYATWPGQATAYKIGELAIRNYRKKAETELKSKFNLKDFHTAILRYGPIPLTMMENLVQHYINAIGPISDDIDYFNADEVDENGCPLYKHGHKMYGNTRGEVKDYPQANSVKESCPFSHQQNNNNNDNNTNTVFNMNQHNTTTNTCPAGKQGDINACPFASKNQK